ncbi:MAG: aminotransferase class V-fold PLP-dependent enzyme [Clostridia bacterium]|nr:aminotransferase class V-fold PLP-dependent enzyme [Clostridia bacterium]
MMIYLDNAATSAKKPLCVYGRLFYESLFGSINAGRGAHKKSVRAIRLINETAEAIAELLNIDDPSAIGFLPNASYALNSAIHGIVKPGDHIVTTSMEHNSVLRPVTQTGNFTIVPADSEGYVQPADIENAIRPETKLIICSHISNVSGSVQPVEKIGKIAKKYGIHFLLDAAQSAGCYEINAKEINADLIAFSGHKGLLGPLGTGGLYVEPGVDLEPYITGGTGSMSESMIQPAFMPDMLQVGTLNSPAIIALGTAVRALEPPSKTNLRESEIARRFIDDLCELEQVEIFGSRDNKRNGTVSFRIPGYDPAEIEDYLDRKKGIIVRSGYHCAPLAHKTLGSSETGTVRVSFGYYNSDYDRMVITDALFDLLRKR